MSVLDEKTVDIISIDKHGRVVLTISDHLAWGDKEHLLILQKKLNTYLAFVESGEVYEQYPNAKGRQFLLQVACKFKPDTDGLRFLSEARRIVEAAGFGLSHRVFAVSYDN